MAINANYYGNYYYDKNQYVNQNNTFTQFRTDNNQTDIFGNTQFTQYSTCEDGKDDGSIGFWGVAKNILKGGVKFVTGMFTDENGDFSWKQTLKTVGMGIAIGLATMIPVIGPLVLPALCTYGMLHGGMEIISGVSNAMSATTDAEAEEAWQQVGSGATEGVASYVGYKATGGFKKAWNKSQEQFGSLTSKPSPKQNAVQEQPVAEEPTAKPETEAEVKAKAEAEAKAKAEAEAKAKAEAEAKAKAEAEAKAKAEAEAKAKAEAEAKAKAEAEAKAKAEAEAKAKAEAEAKAKAEAEAKAKAESEAKAKAEAETKAELARFEISDDSYVSSHHKINGRNSDYRDLVSDLDGYIEELGLDITRGLAKNMVKIDAEFESLPPLQHEQVVYRARAFQKGLDSRNVDFSIIENAKPGDIIVPDKGYSYAAFDDSVVSQYGTSKNGGMLYEIRVPKGAKVSRNAEHWFQHKGEMLMPRGAEYRLISKAVDENGLIKVVMEYVLPTKSNLAESQAILERLNSL